MTDRFTTALDCVDVAFIGDRTLDELPLPSQVGATRVGGVDPNRPRIRAAPAATPRSWRWPWPPAGSPSPGHRPGPGREVKHPPGGHRKRQAPMKKPPIHR